MDAVSGTLTPLLYFPLQRGPEEKAASLFVIHPAVLLLACNHYNHMGQLVQL